MFVKTNALSGTVTSGSFTIGELIDISDYRNIFVEQIVSGAIAGTGSLYVTSLSQNDSDPNGVTNLPEFGLGQPALITLTGNGGSGWAYASSSVTDIDAKWAVVGWQETSGSAIGTGSVVVKCSLVK